MAEVGGAQTYVALLTEALSDQFDVVVAAYGPGPLEEAVRRAGARFVPLHHVRRALHPVRDVLGLFELVGLLRRERPDVLHANSSKAGILGRIAGFLVRVPVRVFTVHGWAFNAYTGAARTAYLLSERLVAPLTSLTICVADSERATGLEARACRPERTVVCHNAVPLPPAREPRSDQPPVVLSVGRLKAPKDFSTFLRALALLEPGSFRARIAGDGPERESLEQEAHDLGIEQAVEFLGEREDVLELIDQCDVFALSTRSEGLPISVLEAMAAGVPIVATAVGGIPELVDDASGLLAPPADARAFGNALEELLRDPALREKSGAAARLRVREHFELDAWRRGHIELYERLLESAGLAPVDSTV